MITTKTKSLALLALLTITAATLAVAAPAAATVVTSDTVEITDNETQDILVDVELDEDPAANNATVSIYDDTGTEVMNRSLNGTVDSWVTESFNITADGNYTVNVTADSATAIGNTEVVVETTNTAVAGLDSHQQWYAVGGAGLAVFLGLALWREYDGY